ncbi:MAG TPA: hypothetical protein DIW31_00945 [Bacteroidales bacterium]|nr:hypothetical protein [Bacteroidales bacterium]
MNRILLFGFLVLFSFCGYPQNTDSLKTLLKTNTNDSIKASLCFQLADAYYYTEPDSSIFYYGECKLYSSSNQVRLVVKALSNLASIYLNQSEYSKAQDCFLECLSIVEREKDSLLLATTHNNLGNLYLQIELNDKAIYHFKEANKFLNIHKNPNEAGKLYGRIGNFYLQQEYYNDAENYYKLAIEFFDKANNLKGIIIATQNLGVIEKRRKNYSKAIEYYQKSLASYESIGFEIGVGQCLANIGNIFTEKKEYDKALINLFDALKLFKKARQVNDEILCYSEIAEIYKIQKDYSKALAIISQAELLLSNLPENNGLRINVLEQLHSIYKGTGNTEMAYSYLLDYSRLNDSIYKSKINNKIQSLRIQFEVEQKDKDLKFLSLENELKDAQIKRKSIFQIFYLIVIGLSALVILSLFYLFISKKRANQELVLKNNEISQQKEEIEAQREEIEAQRDDLEIQRSLAVQQRDEITRQKKNITDSILYAKHIQTALLPNSHEVDEVIPNGFIFFKPLDIVSGDFYWMNNINGKRIISVADCTGHGVPGAFMSVMGINFLNSLIIEQEKIDAGLVLTDLNEYVIKALSHADSHLQDKDGMDISICCIDSSTLAMNYACAKIKVIVFRKGEIIQLDSDCFSIGKTPFFDKAEFTSRTIQLQKGDMIYMMTDGYTDQFGGSERTKFLTSRFKNMILDIAPLDAKDQLGVIEKTIADWQGDNSQIDDMLVVGFRV